jgi:hypothetical protein
MISDRMSGLVMKESLAVVDIKVIEEETTVYNFEVEDDHTYFVTEAEVWVHNADEGYILKIDLVGVGGLNAAHSAKNKYLSGKKTKEEKEEYDEEMIAIQSGKYLTTFESLKKTFINGLNIVKDNILSPIGNGFVSLGSTIGNGILNIGSAIGSGMSYIAQGFTNLIFPHQSEKIPVGSVETVGTALSVSDEDGLKNRNPASKEMSKEDNSPVDRKNSKLVKIDPEYPPFESDVEIVDIEGLRISQNSLYVKSQTAERNELLKKGACVFTSNLILISQELGMDKLVDHNIAFDDGHKKRALDFNAKGEKSNGVTNPGAIAEIFGVKDKKFSIEHLPRNSTKGIEKMNQIINEQLASGRPAAIYTQPPEYAGKYAMHMMVVYGTAVVNGHKVYKVHDVGNQGDKYLDPRNGKPFRLNKLGDFVYSTKSPNNEMPKKERSVYQIWRIQDAK